MDEKEINAIRKIIKDMDRVRCQALAQPSELCEAIDKAEKQLLKLCDQESESRDNCRNLGKCSGSHDNSCMHNLYDFISL